MKKLLKLLLIKLLFITLLMPTSVFAQDDIVKNSTACPGQYELAWVNDSGGFDSVSCFQDFDSAKSELANNGADYVIRHEASYSPSKIIAINSGIAYSYPLRTTKRTTLDITQNYPWHQYRKTTYVVQHRELTKPVTISYDGAGDGRVDVSLMGFDGFTSLKQLDLVPMKFIDSDLTIYLGGQTMPEAAKEDPFAVNPKHSFYKVVQNGNYKDLTFTYYSGWALNKIPKAYSNTIGPAADWMNVGDVYYSHDNQNFYTDKNYTNKVGEYFSYYQYLPLRSASKIKPSTFNQFLTNRNFTKKPSSQNIFDLRPDESVMVNEGQTFVDNQNTYGVNALMVYAMAIHESGYGRSQFAVDRYNLFGWNAIDADPGQATSFASIEDAVMQHMAYNLRSYLDVTNSNFFGQHLGNKGSGFNVKYASDPYWGIGISSTAYEIDKLDNNYNGSLTDYNSESIGIIDDYGTKIFVDDQKKIFLHDTSYGATYQKNYTTILLTNNGETTKVQSSNLIENNKVVPSISGGKYTPAKQYDYNTNVGYIDSSKARVISGKPLVETPGEYLFTSSISQSGDKLKISGIAYKQGLQQMPQYTMTLYDKHANATTVEVKSIENGYEAEVDIANLNGEYFIKLNTDYTDYQYSNYVLTETIPEVNIDGYQVAIHNKDGVSFVTISKSPIQINNTLANNLTRFAYADDGKTLIIEGDAFIQGINASQDTDIKHILVIEDIETQAQVEITGTTTVVEPINLYDGKDYSKIHYTFELDTDTLERRHLALKIKVINGDAQANRWMVSYDLNQQPNLRAVDDGFIEIVQRQSRGYRYELNFTKNPIDTSLVNKPTRRETKFWIDEGNITNGIMSLSGHSWIQMSDAKDVSMQFIVNNQAFNATVSDSPFDISQMVNSKYDYRRSKFNVDIDLNNLPNGEYPIYLKISNAQHSDIFQLDDYTQVQVNPEQIDDKVFKLEYIPLSYYLKITIK